MVHLQRIVLYFHATANEGRVEKEHWYENEFAFDESSPICNCVEDIEVMLPEMWMNTHLLCLWYSCCVIDQESRKRSLWRRIQMSISKDRK